MYIAIVTVNFGCYLFMVVEI